MKKLLLLLVFALLAVHPSLTDLPSEAEAQNDVDPIKYLEQFGYIARQTKTSESLTSPEPSIGALRPSGELVSAVRRFQTMANLPVTGELDEPTRAMMKRPRCGGSDVEGSASFVPSPISGRGISQVEEKSFVGSEKWEKTQLTYRVDRPPKSLKLLEEVDSELARAFDLWSAVCPLSFVRQQAVQQQKGRSTAEQPDISISFVRGAHEDEAPFDGPGKTLAHAFPPGDELGGDIHFDEDEDWTVSSVEGVNLYTVTAHELGHALGVNHSSVEGSLMFPWYQGYDSNLRLHSDDINAIQALYGKRNDQGQVKTSAPRRPDSCSMDFDAVTSIRGEIFLFKDKWFWRRYRNWTIRESPELISRFWKELPPEVDSIDAAYEAPNDNRIVFVRGKKYYEFEGRRSLGRTGRPLTDLGLPPNVTRIDAIFTWRDRTHVTSGRRLWTLTPQAPRRKQLSSILVSTTSSSSASSKFLRLPIRSAFAHPDGGVYVFKDSYYWRLTDADVAAADDKNGRMMMADEDRRLTSHLWMDCSSRSHDLRASSHWVAPVVIMAALVSKNILLIPL